MEHTSSSEVTNFILQKKSINQQAKSKAILHIIDGFAVIMAGSRTDCAKKVYSYVSKIKPTNSANNSNIIGFNDKTTPEHAALVNGTSGHADDYDDSQLVTAPDRIYGLLTHPTVPALSSSLAVGEEQECSGEEFLEAFITGFEVECKIAEAILPNHYKKGFHTTGTIGTFGSFAASSLLRGLDEQELRYGLSIASSLASGIRVNFGTMTKPLHAGRAASNGIVASSLGQLGFTADDNGLDGEWGFFKVLGGGYEADKIIGKLGNPYTIVDPGATFKMYPCGSLGQPSMDSMLEIVEENDLSPQDVSEIRLRAGPNILEPLRYEKPTNEFQAKFSLHFGLTSILLNRKAGLREYSDEYVKNPQVQKMMRKVKTIHDPEIAAMGTDKMRSIVEVVLKDGRIIKKVAENARGTREKPLTEKDVYRKFMECASFRYDQEKANEIFTLLKAIEKMDSINDLTKHLIN